MCAGCARCGAGVGEPSSEQAEGTAAGPGACDRCPRMGHGARIDLGYMLDGSRSDGGGRVRGGCASGRSCARRRGRRRLGVAVAVIALGLAGCSGGSSGPSATSRRSRTTATTATVPGPSPDPSPTASVTAEQHAAQEAKQALVAYRRTLDAVFQRGGTNARQDLSRVAVGEQLAFLLRRAEELRSNSWRQVGSPSVRSADVQDVSVAKGKSPVVVLRTCLDASTDDAVDRHGKTIRKPGALDHFLEIIMLVGADDDRWLVSDESDTQVKTC